MNEMRLKITMVDQFTYQFLDIIRMLSDRSNHGTENEIILYGIAIFIYIF